MLAVWHEPFWLYFFLVGRCLRLEYTVICIVYNIYKRGTAKPISTANKTIKWLNRTWTHTHVYSDICEFHLVPNWTTKIPYDDVVDDDDVVRCIAIHRDMSRPEILFDSLDRNSKMLTQTKIAIKQLIKWGDYLSDIYEYMLYCVWLLYHTLYHTSICISIFVMWNLIRY